MLFNSYRDYWDEYEDRWPITEADVNRERYAAELRDMEREWDIEREEADRQWQEEYLARPVGRRVADELAAAAAAAGFCIGEAVHVEPRVDEDDIPF